jgi:diguanylate cyclase (GGDEF)-like protein/PAS domain S-box-containing protein
MNITEDAGLGPSLRLILDTADFPALWTRGRWRLALDSAPFLSDLAIALACFLIPLALAYFLIHRRAFPVPRFTALLAVFLLCCGLGHALEALPSGHPAHRQAGPVKLVTAVVAWATVLASLSIVRGAVGSPGLVRLDQQIRREMADGETVDRELRDEADKARKLALIARRTDNAVILTDPTGQIEWVNEGFTRITGYSPEEVLGRTPGSFLQGPRTHPGAVEYMRDRLRRGERFQAEIVNYAKDGREYWISFEAQPIHDDQGRLVHFMAIEADITERKRAEEALIASHRERRDIMEAVPEVLFVLDREGRLIRWNRRAEVATGLSTTELAGRPAAGFFPEPQRAAFAVSIARCNEVGHAEVEVDLLRRDGLSTTHHFVWAPLRDGDGQVIGLVGLGRDVAERKGIDRQLRMLQAAVEHANDAILITEAEPIDQPGPRVVYVNPAFTRATGYTAAEILGKTPRILQGPGTDRGTLDGLRKKLKTWRPVRVELLNYRKDGTEFWVELNIRPVADATGYFTHWISIQRDITARKRAELERWTRAEGEVRDLNAQLEHRILRLDALRQIDKAISGSLDLGLTLGIVLDQVLAQLQVDAAAILLVGNHDQALTYAAGKGFRTDAIASTSLRPGEDHAGRAVLEQCHVGVADLTRLEDAPARAGALAGEGFVSYYAVPLVAKGQVRGVLEIYQRSPLATDRDWIAFLEALAGQAAIAIDNASLLRDLQRSHAGLVAAYDATIEGWARALDLRDKETEGHTRRVTEMTVRLARFMAVDESELQAIRRGSLLHDIGKLGIPDGILLKPGPLTDEEWQIMRRHPEYAFEWLAPIATLRPALDIPHFHHERWDGSGYPLGLSGVQIPLPARIFAAVDIWDALRSDRPYREAWPEWRVLEHIESLSGTHLDPSVVESFLRMAGEAAPNPPRDSPVRPAEIQARLDGAARSLRFSEARCREQALEISRLSQLSLTDDLTGLNNRRHFRESLDAAFSLAGRQGQPLSVLMFDVDRFKSYNDDHGHQAGDEVLRTLAEILRGEVRPHDLIARHGGEEFVVLLPDADAEAGRAVAERLRAAIAGHDWPLRRVTASFGVATTPPVVLAAAELVEAADTALYLSKQRGRNQVTHREDLKSYSPAPAPTR